MSSITVNPQVVIKNTDVKNQNRLEQTSDSIPPSDKTYRKNGKKVKKNIGLGWGSLLTAMLVGSMISPTIPDAIKTKSIKGPIQGLLFGLTLSLGGIAIVNHLRNNKRAKLAAELEQPKFQINKQV